MINDIDPYGEEIWENEQLYGLQYLESTRGIYPEVDAITDRIILRREREIKYHNFPWWKKMFIDRFIYIYS
jgi:hypothetical protein